MASVEEASPGMSKRDRLVITASSLGTIFEWYDFFVYGILGALIGKLFFPPQTTRLQRLWRA